MAKQVQIEITVDEEGKVHAKPHGTEGTECLDLMQFLDKIPGFTTLETVKNDDMKNRKVQIVGTQNVKRS